MGPQHPPVPVVDLRGEAEPAAAACAALSVEVHGLVGAAVRHYTPLGVTIGDAVSRRWLSRNSTPYKADVDAVARQIRRPGPHLLNASFEWACTTGVTPTRRGDGMVMVRVLDWDLDGLGRNVAVLRQRGAAGDWLNVGWPGFAGCITGMAPGRFAAAINQAPLPETLLGGAARRRGMWRSALAMDWASERPATWRTDAPPPAHLLRRVMDEAPDFDHAVAMLSVEPIACPALFALCGPGRGQGVILERTRNEAALRWAGPSVAVANHWDAMKVRGAPRWRDSVGREACMLRGMGSLRDEGPIQGDLRWLEAPVMNELTRLVAVMDPGKGALTTAGFEATGPATGTLVLHDEAA